MSEELGVTHPKSEFPEWYIEVVRKGGFLDQRTPVRGCDVIMDWGYGIWEQIQRIADRLFKEHGVKNYYFPTLIPESFLKKEAKHFSGFVPEVAWVTEAGSEKLSERLALRPTSETIMYHMFAQWIRSWRDLPLKVNQWCNVFRWETKATRPFLRSREFLWHEAHTAHATLEDADKQVLDAIEIYKNVIEDACALPVIVLKRTERDKFAGALYTVALETFSREAGRIIQVATVHNLGQNFARAFDVKFKDKDQRDKYVWQTSWGFSTRLIGAIIAVHGDDKGAIIPPRVAPIQVVIVPILFKGKEAPVLQSAQRWKEALRGKGIRVYVDDRDEYTAGWKFNYWELKGVPVRLEIGPRDVEKGVAVMVPRDTGERREITSPDEVVQELEDVQRRLFQRAKEQLSTSIEDAGNLEEVKKIVNAKKIARAGWCGSEECELKVKDVGAEIRGYMFLEPEVPEGKTAHCVVCGKDALRVVYIAKSY